MAQFVLLFLLIFVSYFCYGMFKSSDFATNYDTDNYQGEESDIVLVSLTRSNSRHDIGFMSQPQRLNVLVSRARNALIMIGNSETFIQSRKGNILWKSFFDLLKDSGHFYPGFPVKCANHPDRTATLTTPEHFEEQCSDGGCNEPWLAPRIL